LPNENEILYFFFFFLICFFFFIYYFFLLHLAIYENFLIKFYRVNKQIMTNQYLMLVGSQHVRWFLFILFIFSISSFVNSNPYISIFSFIYFSVLLFGKITKLFYNPHFNATYAIVFLYLSATEIMYLFFINISSFLANEEYASTTIPFSLQKSIVSLSIQKGWISNWFKTGRVFEFASKCSKCLFWKLETPISLTNPSFLSYSIALQVKSRVFALSGFSGFNPETPGQWIINKSRYFSLSFFNIFLQPEIALSYPYYPGESFEVINKSPLVMIFES